MLDQAVRDFYDAWKARYVKQACGAGRYVVVSKVSSGNLTVSEAHGYGMVLMALMAGHDPDARDDLRRHVRLLPRAPVRHHADLMAWNQNKTCQDAEGSDSASDGDLDIAYALLLADKQWGAAAPIDYKAEAKNVIAGIQAGELDATGQYVKLGDWATPGDAPYYDVDAQLRLHARSLPQLRRRDRRHARGPTARAAPTRSARTADQLQRGTGLLPDFVVDPLGTPASGAGEFPRGANDGAYDYNACRDPWRLGTDYLVAGEAAPRPRCSDQHLDPRRTGGDPDNIRSGYQLNGTPSPDTDYLSMAFVAPLGVGAMVDAANQTWLNDVWDLVVATPIAAEGYYENTLKLLSMIVMSGNWWRPESVSGGCTRRAERRCAPRRKLSATPESRSATSPPANDADAAAEGLAVLPAGHPRAAPYTGGAQVLVEDSATAAPSFVELSRLTAPRAAAAAGGCDPRATAGRSTAKTQYRNRSTALDPPSCAPAPRAASSCSSTGRATRVDLDLPLKARDEHGRGAGRAAARRRWCSAHAGRGRRRRLRDPRGARVRRQRQWERQEVPVARVSRPAPRRRRAAAKTTAAATATLAASCQWQRSDSRRHRTCRSRWSCATLLLSDFTAETRRRRGRVLDSSSLRVSAPLR